MAGRKKKPDAMRRDKPLRIRLTPHERKAIDAAAAKTPLETSTWARAVLLLVIGYQGDPVYLDEAMLKKLRAVKLKDGG